MVQCGCILNKGEEIRHELGIDVYGRKHIDHALDLLLNIGIARSLSSGLACKLVNVYK